jgi:hypothetical protein
MSPTTTATRTASVRPRLEVRVHRARGAPLELAGTSAVAGRSTTG